MTPRKRSGLCLRMAGVFEVRAGRIVAHRDCFDY
jgi:limonene-1,2-epoxide hydrolase